jgi:DNA-binding transcriptional regulator YhcF (GntR family)
MPQTSDQARVDQTTVIANNIRHKILSGIHLGRLKHGDRLDSIRATADELGVDHRTVARAYQRLQNEGLVDIRGRSGIFLVEPKLVGTRVLAATAQWLAQVLAEAWSRHVELPQFAELVTKCVGAGVRCACVDSTADHAVAFCAELEEDFGLDTFSVPLILNAARIIENEAEVREALGRCDFVATTAFAHLEVQRIAQELGKPVVIITVHPEMRQLIEAGFLKGPVGVVVADPRYGERIRAHFGKLPSGEDYVRVFLPETLTKEQLAAEPPVFMTRAARRKLGSLDEKLLPPPPPFISPSAAQQITEIIVHLTLEKQ